jgi:hypothetical protein
LKIFNLKELKQTEIILPEIDNELKDFIINTFNDINIVLNNTYIIKEHPLIKMGFKDSEDKRKLMYIINGSINMLGEEAYEYITIRGEFLEWFNEMFIGFDRIDIMKILTYFIIKEVNKLNSLIYEPEPFNLNLV